MMISYQDRLPECGPDVYIAPGAFVIGSVLIGRDSSVFFNTVIRGDVNTITIGEKTNIQDNCTLHVTGSNALRVGSMVTVGHNAVLHGCTIGDDVLIGMGAIVLDGACIESGSIVAAGSLVPPGKHIPAGSMVMGSPGAVVRSLREAEREQIRHAAESYLMTKARYLKEASAR